MKKEKLRELILGFAIGDALGAPFEFKTPSAEDIRAHFYGTKKLQFTDDTFLLLSSISAHQKSLVFKESSEIEYWKLMKVHTCEWLIDWLDSGDLRGIGETTLNAVKQMRRHKEKSGELESFCISTLFNYDESASAGNGILSRALPLILIESGNHQHFKNWLSITHLHIDGHRACGALEAFLIQGIGPQHKLSESAKGFYAPETLQIASNAVLSSKEVFEVFSRSIVPDGDNDSIAALAVALWVHKYGFSDELEQQYTRFIEKDIAILEEYF